ncbi:integrase catalytic domain-containing protein [Trichonephila clavipes]|nr:integrase catalytic domain-containing protein [Trichonephila clavipes]
MSRNFLPSLEHTFNKVLKNLKDQEASHVELSTPRATKQHHYDYKIGSLCFIKTPNIKSNLSPKLRPKFEGPYRVIERFSNVNYRVQHVEQLRKRFNTHVNRMIPFIKRFSYLHLKIWMIYNQTRRRLRGWNFWMSDSCRLRRGLPSPSTAVADRDSAKFFPMGFRSHPLFPVLRYGAVAMRLNPPNFLVFETVGRGSGVVARRIWK